MACLGCHSIDRVYLVRRVEYFLILLELWRAEKCGEEATYKKTNRIRVISAARSKNFECYQCLYLNMSNIIR